ncbi:MAG: ribose-5-phosphate isomerase RpiA [Candidatus Dadabacteria bacterium]|nr:MAG: ribose-5-phosphate isomerase RpiA [Candidatus Dadabacteria bacterium]
MDQGKINAGKEIAKRVRDGDLIAAGTGSTVEAALKEIGRRVSEERIRLSIVPTSLKTAEAAARCGITVVDPTSVDEFEWGFDGADEVDPRLRLIKGGGGAMLMEKILAVRCKRFIVIVDESKLVQRLGERCPVPVEVIPEATSYVKDKLLSLGAERAVIRKAKAKHGPVITEKGNMIVDASFAEIGDDLEDSINQITGVVENGLFTDHADEIIVGRTEGVSIMNRS